MNIKETEQQIQRAILNYLQLLENQGKCYCARSGAGAVKLDSGRYFKTGKKGVQDITCCINGQYVALEVKTSKGKLSESQRETQEKVIATGGIYCVVRNIDDVIKVIKDL